MIAQSPHAGQYERARALADAGRHEEAIAAIREYLRHEPEDGEAFNDAGALLYAAGRFDEAADSLKRAAACMRDAPGQALWNLAEVYLAGGRPAEVLPLFDGLAQAQLMTADLANRTATRFLDSGDVAGAVEAIIYSVRLAPQQDALLPIYERVRALRPKVAICCEFPDVKFMQDIYAFINARFETRLVQGQGAEELAELLRWCDIAWLEWCTNQAVTASQMPKTCRTIIRLHRFEAFGTWPERVRWENIDALVTIGNNHVLEHLKHKVPGIEQRTRIVPIPNGVNLDRFAFRRRRRGKNLACVGYVSLQKNPMLLLQCFQKLHAADPEFRLFFAGNFQDSGILEAYLPYMVKELGLADAVFFDGWQDDVAGWLEDKHYLLTASVVEGHPVGVLEGMASGMRPVVHTFPGCRDFFPEKYLWRTPDEFCQRILSDTYKPDEYRDFVATRFPLKAQLDRINELLLGFERNPVAKPVPAAAGTCAAAKKGSDPFSYNVESETAIKGV